MRKEDMVSGQCNRIAEEQEMCMADILDCSKAEAMKDFDGEKMGTLDSQWDL